MLFSCILILMSRVTWGSLRYLPASWSWCLVLPGALGVISCILILMSRVTWGFWCYPPASWSWCPCSWSQLGPVVSCIYTFFLFHYSVPNKQYKLKMYIFKETVGNYIFETLLSMVSTLVYIIRQNCNFWPQTIRIQKKCHRWSSLERVSERTNIR